MPDKKVVVIPSPEFKLKHGKKDQMVIDFMKMFEFVPRRIIVRLVSGRNNTFVIGAVDEEVVSQISKDILKQEKEKGKKLKKDVENGTTKANN